MPINFATSPPVDGTVRDFVNRARARSLEYRGFVRTNGGVCIHCGKYPESTHCLHAVFDPAKNQLSEYGSDCYPRYFVPELEKAVFAETDPVRKHQLLLNWNQLCPGRCCIAEAERPIAQRSTPVPANQCVAGGYRFVVQAVGTRTFTVQVYDDELALLGRFVMKHYHGKTDQEVIGLPEADLIQAGEEVRSALPASQAQDKATCKVCRLPIGHLANRV